jgi:acyl transferase domain-containing protein
MSRTEARTRDATPEAATPRDGVAIIGMSCLFPGAPDLNAYWRNILNSVDAVTDPPAEAWDPSIHYDPDSAEPDRVYCKRGGFLGSLVTFNPLEHGIPPVGVGGEPDQWLSLRVARDALADAGYPALEESVRRRTAVILGKGTYLNGGNSLAIQHSLILPQTVEILRQVRPDLTDEDLEAVRRGLRRSLPDMGPELVPGLIPNIGVGRIANRLDLMGPTYTVDAACASSLLAVQLALRDLRNGECDLALVGGSQVWMPVPSLSVFCQLGALSRRQQIRPFDKDADGTLLGEGIGMVVLKRLADAERDGDRIYAVVRGVGMASDGKGTSVMAPRIDGEVLAIRRAYEAAGVSPDSVELIEAHGTGTPVGDIVEIQALARVFGPRKARLPRCAIGSVKSMISHTIPAAGVAALIKTALALHHKVLPPTLHCENPNPKLGLDSTEFYINSTTRPWVHAGDEPRRAGISSFGFGGINAHAVLEEYTPPADRPSRAADHRPPRDTEVILIEAETREALLSKVQKVARSLAVEHPDFTLADVAFTLHRERLRHDPDALRLATVAGSIPELRAALERAAGRLADPSCGKIRELSGLYFAAEPLGRAGKLAFLIPGEGAQYPHMLADLALHFPEVLEQLDQYDRIVAGLGRECLPSDFMFPRASLPEAERDWVDAQLWSIEGAMGAVRVANLALHAILERLAIRPDVMVGHSSGEYAALQLSGMLDLQTEAQVAEAASDLFQIQDQVFREGFASAALLALGASREQAEAIARKAGARVFVAMDNCPHQVVVACQREDAPRVAELAKAEGFVADVLPFDRPYHTPLFGGYAEKLRGWADRLAIRPPRVPLYSCTTVAPFPDDPDAVRALLVDHWVKPVEFRRTVQTLHDEGVRIFVECGPRGNLTAFVEDTLRGRPFLAIPANTQRRSGVTQLNHLVGVLASQGVDLDTAPLFEGRGLRPLSWDAPAVTPPRPASSVTLRTGFPEMRLPSDVLERLRSAPPKPEAPAQPEHAASCPSPTPAEPPASPRLTPPAPARDVPASPPTPAPPRPQPTPRIPMPTPAMGQRPSNIPAGTPGRDAAPLFRDFLATMDRFLVTQREVLRDCLGTPPATPPAHRTPASAPAFPLLGQVVGTTPGRTLVCRRTFDPAEDRYLLDHALGLAPSDADPALRGLMILPLTMTLEILAEAAARLVPDLRVVGFRDVTASRWIAFEDGAPETLEVSARRDPERPEVVRVSLRNLTDERQPGRPPQGPVAEATVLMASSYPNGGQAETPRVDGPPSRFRPERLYLDAMFHGPRWRGVASIDRTGPEGAVATLPVRPFADFFAHNPAPRFVLDPVVLDAAGQIVGFWTMEHLSRGRIVFPFRLETLDLFGPPPPPGTNAKAAAVIRLVGESQTRSDITISAHGRPWMRLAGWWDKRFDLPDNLFPIVLPSGVADVSEPFALPSASIDPAHAFACRRVVVAPASDLAFWRQVWSHRVLGRAERQEFRRLDLPEARRLEWLAARTAAKEGVRDWLRRRHRIEAKLADIALRPDASGRLVAVGPWSARVPRAPLLAMASMAGAAYALVGDDPRGEAARPALEVASLALQHRVPGEPPLNLSPEQDEEWRLRLWAARRAVARAFGADSAGPARVQSYDLARGLVLVRWPEPSASIPVQTTRDHDRIVAATLARPVADPAADRPDPQPRPQRA